MDQAVKIGEGANEEEAFLFSKGQNVKVKQ